MSLDAGLESYNIRMVDLFHDIDLFHDSIFYCWVFEKVGMNFFQGVDFIGNGDSIDIGEPSRSEEFVFNILSHSFYNSPPDIYFCESHTIYSWPFMNQKLNKK